MQAFASLVGGRDKPHPLIKRKDSAEWQLLADCGRSLPTPFDPKRPLIAIYLDVSLQHGIRDYS